jgi:hypothetical protein
MEGEARPELLCRRLVKSPAGPGEADQSEARRRAHLRASHVPVRIRQCVVRAQAPAYLDDNFGNFEAAVHWFEDDGVGEHSAS